jgi:ribulose-phosphate 3-epimerase
MSAIVPAIIPKNKNDLSEKLARFNDILEVETIQIDVVDGLFASPASWPYKNKPSELSGMIAQGEHIPFAGRFRYDIDLMVENPEEVIGDWIAVGATRLTVHAESTQYLPRLIHELTSTYGYDKSLAGSFLSLGLALNVTSDIALVEQYIEAIDYVQFMGIATIGKQGQPFDPRVLEKVSAFRKRYPDVPVQVDGAVTKETASQLLAAGVSRLVVGHALQEVPDLAKAFAEFSAISEQYGRYES